MKKPFYLDKKTPPDFTALNKACGTHLPRILDFFMRFDLVKEWKFFSKNSGWILRINRNNKTVGYLQPFHDHADMIFVLDPHEEHSLMHNNAISKDLKLAIQNEKRHEEGKSVRLQLETQEDVEHAGIILKLKSRN